MMPSLSGGTTAIMTNIMMITMVGIGKNAASFMTCLTKNPIERIEYA
jgi:hypothetical protein